MRRAGAAAALIACALVALALAPSAPAGDGRAGAGAAGPARAKLPVLRLTVGAGPRCTATLIGPREAVTAAHCLQRRSGGFHRPYRVRLIPAWPGSGGPVRAEGLYPARGFARRAGSAAKAEQADHDWALIELRRRFPESPPAAVIASGPPEAGEGYLLAAFADRNGPSTGLRRRRDCRVGARSGALWRHSCMGPPGTSGAPLLLRGSRRWRIVAMHIGRMHHRDGRPPQSVAVALPPGLAGALPDQQARTP